MTKALVAIGVGRAGSLTRLPGAARDAMKVADWARAAGYQHVRVLTDKGSGKAAEVTAEQVCHVCEGFLKIKGLERLVIFFTGHGLSPWPGHEFWLLSGWERNANQAINASATLFTAQGIAKPQISFIADACRLTAQQGMGLSGMVILPKPKSRSGKARVDEFFATRFGDASQEIKPASRRASYGIFTAELLGALRGGAAVTKPNGNRVVTSRSLEDFLTDRVPRACSRIQGAEIQHPGTRAQWRHPKDDYAVFPALIVDPFPGDHWPRGFPGDDYWPRGLRVRPEPPQLKPPQPMPAAVTKAAAAQRGKIDIHIARYRAAQGRGTFETATGVTVIGAKVLEVVASRFDAKPFEEGGVWHVRVEKPPKLGEPPPAPSHLLIKISNPQWPGYWISVPTFPRLVATAVIDENGFSSLNYEVSRRFQNPHSLMVSHRIDPVLAEASALFRYGVMPKPDRVARMIDLLREGKGNNPALAIIAAHICYRIGELRQIEDMENYAIGRGNYTPFDLLLLSGRKKPAQRRELVGAFPLMSPGWGLLAVAEFKVDPALQHVFGGIAPSLWSMTTPKAGQVLAEVISNAKPIST